MSNLVPYPKLLKNIPLVALFLLIIAGAMFAQPTENKYPGYGRHLDTAKMNQHFMYEQPTANPCNSDDCNAGWNESSFCISYLRTGGGNDNFTSDFSIDYTIPANENPSGEVTTVSVYLAKICFQARINCDGILEIQPMQIWFSEFWSYVNKQINDNQLPSEFKIPIDFMVEQVFEEILRIGSRTDGIIISTSDGSKIPLVELKNNNTTQFIQTSIGSCWAYKEVTKADPDWNGMPGPINNAGIMAAGFKPVELKIASPYGHHIEYYSVPCEGSSCCSKLFNVSWNQDSSANMEFALEYRNSGCSGSKKVVDGETIYEDVECQPVCDWHNFRFDDIMSIGEIIANVSVSDNTINVRILEYDKNIKEINYIITDMYGNEILNSSDQLSNNLILKSSKLPNGNYRVGLFDKNNKLLLNKNINLSGE